MTKNTNASGVPDPGPESPPAHLRGKVVIRDARGRRNSMLAHHPASEENLWRGARCESLAQME